MNYNVCPICGAGAGRAGLLISTENQVHACLNCHDTRTSKTIIIHSNLIRTDQEIQKTINILK